MKRVVGSVVALIALSLVVASSGGGAAGATATSAMHERSGAVGGGGHAIVGTWMVDVQPREGEPFQALVTFSPGGGLIETESASPGAGLGTWAALGRRRVAATLQRFEFNEAGAPAGRVVVRTIVDVRDDQFSGPFEFTAYDPEGAEILTGDGTATARPFEVQLPRQR